MSAGKEFQMDGAATEKERRASTVCVNISIILTGQTL